jgi:hypothetical protein
MKSPFRSGKSDIFIIVSIFTLPFLFFLYTLIPELERWSVLSYEIDFFVLVDMQGAVYCFALRLLTLGLLSLWYMSCRYKWYKLILLLILHELFYIGGIALEIIGYNIDVDLLDLIYQILSTVVLFGLYYPIINKARRWFLVREDRKNKFYQNLQEEINTQIKANTKLSLRRSRQIEKELAALRANKTNLDKRIYLKELIKLRESC